RPCTYQERLLLLWIQPCCKICHADDCTVAILDVESPLHMLYSNFIIPAACGGIAMEMNEKKIGVITHFLGGPSAAVLNLSAQLKVGDEISIVGSSTDLVEEVRSMQIEHNSVAEAYPGDDVAILVSDIVRAGDEVYLRIAEPVGFAASAEA